jgi:hypothetical protein
MRRFRTITPGDGIGQRRAGSCGDAYFSLGRGTIEMLFGFTSTFRECIGPVPEGAVTLAIIRSVCVVQGEVLSLRHDTEKTVPAKKPDKVRNTDQQMGSALRSVYQKTVDEAIPDDLLDLLGKLD